MNSIRLRSPGDVVAVLPYQLGYHPDDSLVVVALRDRAVVLVERVDLPGPSDADEASRVLLPPLLREEPDAVLLVAYETRAGQGRPALDVLRDQLVRAGLDVLDRMVVRDGRWFAVDCVTGCCPAAGSPVPEAADTPAVAEFVALGISPLSGRGALVVLVAADPRGLPRWPPPSRNGPSGVVAWARWPPGSRRCRRGPCSWDSGRRRETIRHPALPVPQPVVMTCRRSRSPCSSRACARQISAMP